MEAGIRKALVLIQEFFNSLSFRKAIWLFPVAFALHVAEEICCFTAWAQKYASPDFTFDSYLKIHAAGIISAFLAAFFLSKYPKRFLVFLFFTFLFAPAVFWNVFFHAGATVYFGTYCPGVVTALVIYIPVFVVVTKTALKEGLLVRKSAGLVIAIAGVFHFFEVGHNVFKAW